MTLTTPLSGKIFIGRMGLAVVNLCAKFEVFWCTSYEVMNGDAKCRKWGGGLGWLGGTQGHGRCHHSIRAHTTSYSTLIETMGLFVSFSRYSEPFVEKSY